MIYICGLFLIIASCFCVKSFHIFLLLLICGVILIIIASIEEFKIDRLKNMIQHDREVKGLQTENEHLLQEVETYKLKYDALREAVERNNENNKLYINGKPFAKFSEHELHTVDVKSDS